MLKTIANINIFGLDFGLIAVGAITILGLLGIVYLCYILANKLLKYGKQRDYYSKRNKRREFRSVIESAANKAVNREIKQLDSKLRNLKTQEERRQALKLKKEKRISELQQELKAEMQN